jgi:predicted amidophosphoribosyltransferase
MLRDLAADLLDALLPARCAACGRGGGPLCAHCAGSLRPCPISPPPPGVTWWAALYAYEGAAREVVARAKYRNERAALAWLGGLLASACAHAPVPIDVVTWAPASASRRAAYGVDHAELLARALGRALSRPTIALLARGPGPAQTGRDAATRRQGPSLLVPRAPGARTVLVVDDVATTGGTLAAAARALREAGARDILAATAARTPRPSGGTADGRGAAPAYTRDPATR